MVRIRTPLLSKHNAMPHSALTYLTTDQKQNNLWLIIGKQSLNFDGIVMIECTKRCAVEEQSECSGTHTNAHWLTYCVPSMLSMPWVNWRLSSTASIIPDIGSDEQMNKSLCKRKANQNYTKIESHYYINYWLDLYIVWFHLLINKWIKCRLHSIDVFLDFIFN